MKILITEPEYFPTESQKILGTIGEVAAKRFTKKELPQAVSDVDVLVVRIETTINKKLINSAPKLKIIASATTGLNHIDTKYAAKKGIKIINLSGNHTVPTAEHAFALLLGLARRIAWAHASASSGKWERYNFFGRELDGKTMGLIGLGRIGGRVAQYARAFGMKVLAYDPYAQREAASNNGIELVSLNDVLSKSDFVSLHAVLTEETRHMMNAERFSLMKPAALLINAARAEIVDTAALIMALENGTIAGAAFDVFEKEPAGKKDMLVKYAKTHTNLLLTPHLGASTFEAINNASLHIANEVVKAVKETGSV